MQQKNKRSTNITLDLTIEMSLDFSPSQESNNAHRNIALAALLRTTDLKISYSDQTGRFPVHQSSHGYQYMMILYNYDCNTILSKPLKSCQASELPNAWTKLHEKLQANGFAAKLRILDNKCSDKFK